MTKSKTAALIPARYASTRLPAKLVQDLDGMSVIQRTYLNTKETGLFDHIIVATDHEIIQTQIEKIGGKVFKSTKPHESGFDRIAEAAECLNADIIVNIQGDEPFVDHISLNKLIRSFDDSSVQIASLMFNITESEAQNPNAVKVVIDQNSNALYFSRSPIPYNREKTSNVQYWKHIGIYAYRKDLLMEFTLWDKSNLEKSEMLEQLRILEHGVKIRMIPTTHQAIAIDTFDDLDKARKFMDEMKSKN